MRKCTYLIAVPSEHNPDELCFYHVLRDHLVRICQSKGESFDVLLKKLQVGSMLTESESDALSALSELEFVVPDSYDEVGVFDRWYRDAIQANASGSFVATVLTSMSCNLRCTYCYEKEHLSRGQFMSPNMASKVSQWLISRIAEFNIKRMNVVFFGGEPLLNCNAIESVGATLAESCRAFGIEWKAGVVTNGTLLTEEVARILARSGVSWAKVTLDGSEDAHDRLRAYANGKGTFRRIMENLERAAPYLKIMIGGNFNDSNIYTIPTLLDELAIAPWKDALISVGFKPIASNGKERMAAERAGCSPSSFTEKQIGQIVELREEIKKRGLPVMSDPSVGPCDFFRPNAVTIGVDGSIYPCAAFVGNSELVVGSVESNEPTAIGKEIAEVKPWGKDCYECSYLPVCTGGCRVPALFEKGDIDAMVCDKRFYERLLPRIVAECDDEYRCGAVKSSLLI